MNFKRVLEKELNINIIYVIIRKLYFTLYIMLDKLLVIRIKRGEGMDKSEFKWAWIIGILLLLAYIVPYVLLRNIDAWYGSFLFWNLFAIIVIIFNVFMTIDWRDES